MWPPPPPSSGDPNDTFARRYDQRHTQREAELQAELEAARSRRAAQRHQSRRGPRRVARHVLAGLLLLAAALAGTTVVLDLVKAPAINLDLCQCQNAVDLIDGHELVHTATLTVTDATRSGRPTIPGQPARTNLAEITASAELDTDTTHSILRSRVEAAGYDTIETRDGAWAAIHPSGVTAIILVPRNDRNITVTVHLDADSPDEIAALRRLTASR